MNIADKLRKVLEIKNNIKAALEEKGIENVGTDFNSYAESIANIKGGGDEPEIPTLPDPPVVDIPELPTYEDVVASIPEIPEPEPWTRPADWIDLEAEIQKHSHNEYPYRVALLLQNDGNDSIKLGYYFVDSLFRDTTRCNCITVDDGDRGFEYEFGEDDPATVTHEWGDYEGTNGYRWVIYHFNTPDIIFTSIPNCTVQLIFDGVNANVYGRGIYYSSYDATSLGTHSSNIREIVGLNEATFYIESRLTNPTRYSLPGSNPKLEYFTLSLIRTTSKISFNGCKSLKLIPEGVDFSGTTSFSSMFSGCSSLVTIPEIDTSNGTSFNYMFSGCSSLVTIPEIDTSNGTSFSSMFSGCSSLVTIPEIDTTNGTNFSYMFQNCSSLVTIPLINISNGTNFSYMFQNCSSLVTIPLINTTNGTNFSYMFLCCPSLVTIPETLNTSNGTNFSYMFYGCASLASIPIKDISKVTSTSNVSKIFNGCVSLVTIPEELINSINLNVDKLSLFDGCSGIKYLPYITDNYTTNIYGYLSKFSNLETIVGITAPNSNTALNLSSSLKNLKYVGKLDLPLCPQYKFPTGIKYIGSIDISSSTGDSMFKDCSSLVSISEIINNSEAVKSFNYMFSGCSSLVTIPEIDTSNGTIFIYMFTICSSLSTIPVLYTSNGTNFSYMFAKCSSLVTVPKTLNTSNGTNFGSMFQNCSSLEKSPKLNLGKVTSISSSTSLLFDGCKKLKYLSTIEAPNATTIQSILGGDSYDPKQTMNIETIEGIKAPKATSINLSSIGNSYYNLQYGKVKHIGDIDISSYTSTFNIPGAYSLTSVSFIGTVKCKIECFYSGLGSYNNLYPVKDLSIEALDYSQDFSYWKCLTKQSLLNILNALVPQEGTTKTLTLNTTCHIPLLSDEEKAIAINKGWTLSEYNA